MVWRGETAIGEDYVLEPIPADLQDQADEYRQAMLETIAENDEAFMEKFFEDADALTEDEIHAAIRRVTLAGGAVPIVTGTAFKNKGVQPMLDAVIRYLPSPLDVEGVTGHKPNKPEEEICS